MIDFDHTRKDGGYLSEKLGEVIELLNQTVDIHKGDERKEERTPWNGPMRRKEDVIIPSTHNILYTQTRPEGHWEEIPGNPKALKNRAGIFTLKSKLTTQEVREIEEDLGTLSNITPHEETSEQAN